MILNKRPNIIKDKNKVVQMMGICIDNRNTLMAFNLYQHYCAYIIQRTIKKHINRLKKISDLHYYK